MTARVSVLLKSRASLTCFRACFLPGRAKDLSALRYQGRVLSEGTFTKNVSVVKKNWSDIHEIRVSFVQSEQGHSGVFKTN